MLYKNLYAPYVDNRGNLSEGQYDSGNPHLFNGQIILLEMLLGHCSDLPSHTAAYIESCKIVPGLYSRYPISETMVDRDNVSHDEYNGLMLCSLKDSQIATHVYNYGSKNAWQFFEVPFSNFFSFLFKNPLRAIISAYKFFKEVKETTENDSSVDYKYPPSVVALRYWRQPRDVCFYKLMAGKKSSFLERLYLSVSIIKSSFSGFSYARGGTMIMSWCRYKALEIKNKNTGIIKVANCIFSYRLKKLYGPNYVKIMFLTYFPKDHPANRLLSLLASDDLS